MVIALVLATFVLLIAIQWAVTAHRARVLAACKANKIFFMDSGVNANNVIARIQEGAMISRVNQQVANMARVHTKRQMPW